MLSFSRIYPRLSPLSAALRIAIVAPALVLCTPAGAGTIIVTHIDVAPTASTCTLPQAILAANKINGVSPTMTSSSTPEGNCTGATTSTNLIVFNGWPTIHLTSIDNYWYGANALPPIASDIWIGAVDGGAHTGATLVAVHTGDPTPLTVNAFRFFYVSGGLSGELPVGSLFMQGMVLKGGHAKGGNGGFLGGGGAGMGGAIFNQGTLSLNAVSLIGNTAHGGNQTSNSINTAGGGIGQDGIDKGGGFGGQIGTFGGSGSTTNKCHGGGGGGFITGANGGAGNDGNGTGGNGGGSGGLGGAGATATGAGGFGGDGGGGSGGTVGSAPACSGVPSFAGGKGGRFGYGGDPGGYNFMGVAKIGGGGGGGVGGGGGDGIYTASNGGGGGGFGGGAGNGGTGGFGGGGHTAAGFGGGEGGAGMGGAIFNHRGGAYLQNVTATDNAAVGGLKSVFDGTTNGSALGAVVFNLNGKVWIDFSTLAGNTLTNTNGAANESQGPSDGSVYSISYGNKIEDGSASTAVLRLNNSIIRATDSDSGNANDVFVSVVNGNNVNAAYLQTVGTNFVAAIYANPNVNTGSGISSVTTDPHLGSPIVYPSRPYPIIPVLRIGADSPAYDAVTCIAADRFATLAVDARLVSRPQGAKCDLGAFEYDGDYIFAGGFQKL